jgi:hypothetical protein
VFVHPAVLPRFKGRTFGLSDESHLLARLRRAAKLPPATAIMGEGTVSATILNLAAHLGCKRVVFVGQDFALADDGRTHASNTFYTDLGCNSQDGEQVFRLPGTTRPEVNVPARLRWYLRIVETLIAKRPGIQYFNTSERGAAIAGAPFLEYQSAAALLENEPTRDFAAELDQLGQSKPSQEIRMAMAAEMARARSASAEALQLALTAALSGELALNDKSASSRRVFDTAAQRFEQWRSSRTAEQDLLFEGRTKAEIFEAEKRRIQFPLNAPNLHLHEADELAWAYAEGAFALHRQLLQLSLSP